MNPYLLENTKECIICLENINSTTTNLTLNCQHTFHKDCIDKWFQINTDNSCPICRVKPNNETIEEVHSENNINILNNINFYNERLAILCLTTTNIIVDSIFILLYDNVINLYISFFINWFGFIGAYNLKTLYLNLYLYSWVINFFIVLIDLITNFNMYLKYSIYLIFSFIIKELFAMYICIIIDDLVRKINTYNNRYLIVLDNY